MRPLPALQGLYLITPDILDTQALVMRVAEVLPYAALLQYRNKRADSALAYTQASALQALCARTGVALVINDDVELALRLGAHGVHLGEDDGAIETARARLGPQAIIGASCYDSLARAQHAMHAGASYVAFGAVFASPTKPLARRAEAALFAHANVLGYPTVAIGGITPDNIHSVVAMGADMCAVISGVFDAPDAVTAARHCAAAFA